MRRKSAGNALPLAIGGPAQAEPEIKQTSVIVYGASGKMLNFNPEELRKPPESFEGDTKLLAAWEKTVPVFMGKAQRETAIQRMSLEQVRTIMERAALNRVKRREDDRKKRNEQRKEQTRRPVQATECVLLRNMVDRGQLDDDLKDEIITEMSRYGTILKATAHEVEDPGFPEEEAVRIFIQFSSTDEALKAQQDLHMRLFDGRYVACCFFPLPRLMANDLKPQPSEPRLPAKCRERVVAPDPSDPAAPTQPATRKHVVPEKLLPPYVQALVEVLQAAAAGEEVTDEMICKADPVYEKELRTKREEEDRLRQDVQDEAEARRKVQAAMELAAKLTEELAMQQPAAPVVTSELDGLD
eukprot:TRINITY_DN22265_c0_g1_i4.p1 TRINITY_DN22265_c0_g1~~TRINITY_DN22265_c0_g1_i4.p1  ORF type:complete len:387 (+),score=113.51 TRINITY_DN22265_c0_g1_i4:96-1163(+)